MEQRDQTGSEVGNFRLLEKINSGSFGTVYKAEHKFIRGHIVAIKLLHQNIASTREQEQFIQEAQFLALLEHPHILSLLDFGFLGTQPYLIARYAGGGSLRDLLKRSPLLPPDQLVNLLTKVGQALHFAHQRQIIHRDLKPENILFTAQGEPLLADFGIATMISTASGEHLTTVSGTPSYMSPEQFRGLVSKESDQYALGCIAYELVTGRRPFSAPDFIALGFMHASEPPAPPNQYNPQLPAATQAAILKAMAKNRDERYADIPAFLNDFSASLAPFLAQRSVTQLAPVTSMQSLPSMPSQGPESAQPLTAASVRSLPSMPSLTNGPAVSVQEAPSSLVQNIAQTTPADASSEDQLTSITKPKSQAGLLSKGYRAVQPWRWLALATLALCLVAGGVLSYFTLLAPGRHPQSKGLASVTSATLQATLAARATAQKQQTALVQADATNQAQVIATAQAKGHPQLLWTYVTGGIVLASAAVVDRTVFIGSNDDNIYAINSLTGHQIWTFVTKGEIHSRPTVVNGLVYIGSADWRLIAIDAATGKQRWAFTTGSGVSGSPVVANGIAYGTSGDGKLYALDANSGHLLWTYTTGGPIWSSATYANGLVYVSSIDHKLYAIDATTGKEKWTFSTRDILPISPTVADGLVFVGSDDHFLYALNATTGQLQWSFLTGNAIWSVPTVSKGVLYFGSFDHKVYALSVATGHLKWAFTTGDRVWSSPTVVNDIVYIGSTDHKLYAIDSLTGQPKWSFATGDAIKYSSPTVVNGVVYIGSDDTRLYSIATGE